MPPELSQATLIVYSFAFTFRRSSRGRVRRLRRAIQAYPVQLSGTVVDSSGAVIAGATVQVRSANGPVQKTTQSDENGTFVISGLAAGDYRLVVSEPDFETKEVPVTIETTEAPAPLRISLAVRAVSTTVNVQGRADDLSESPLPPAR